MRLIFNFILITTLCIATTGQINAQDRHPAGNITINGVELDEFLNDVIETIEEKVDDKSITVNIGSKGDQRFRGSNNIITEERQIPTSYSGINTSRGIKVTLEDRVGSTAIIRANDNLMPFIKIENKGSVLIVKIDDEIRSLNNITAEVNLPRNPNLTQLNAASAAKINVKHNIQSPELEINASSAADIRILRADVRECEIETSSAATVVASVKGDECSIEASSAAKATVNLLVKHCEADASSAANIVLSGEAGTLDLEASSAADIKATDVKTIVSASADASSGADIKVNAGKSLSASASSGGSVAYKSDHDNIQIKKSSGGSVRKM